MIYLDEIKNMVIYKSKAYLPITETDKRKGNVCIILSPNLDGTIKTINYPLFLNKLYTGYYIEKNITYFINQENALIEDISHTDILLECNNVLDSKYTLNDYNITDNKFDIVLEDGKRMITFFSDVNDELLSEGSSNHNVFLRKLLYGERFRKPKEVFDIYEKVKDKCPNITRTFLNYKKYREFNMYVDFYYYNELFFKNNLLKLNKGLDLYFDFLTRFFNDKRLLDSGYTDKCVLINVESWINVINNKNYIKYNESINPLSIIFRLLQTDLDRIKEAWKDIPFIFFGPGGYFKIDFTKISKTDLIKYKSHINRILNSNNEPDKEGIILGDTAKAMVTTFIDKIEDNKKIKINNLVGDSDTTEEELIKRIENAAVSSNSIDDLENKLNQDVETKRLIYDLANNSDDTIKVSAQRLKRNSELKKSLREQKIDNVPIKDILEKHKEEKLESTDLKIDSPNKEWKDMSYINFNKDKDIKHDVVKQMNYMSKDNKKYPIHIRKVTTKDTSTSETYMKTMTFELEDNNNKRYKVDLNVPEVVDDKFLFINGNLKTIQGQLMFIPVVKISPDRVQVVSDYNKLFIYKYGPRGYIISDRIIKTLNKVNNKNYTIKYGDNVNSNLAYELPIDYEELSSVYSYIKIKDLELYFDQDLLYKMYSKDIKNTNTQFPIGLLKNKIIYCKYDEIYSEKILNLIIEQDPEFEQLFNDSGISTKYQYSKCSILNNEVPLVLVLAYSEGLFSILNKAKIKYTIEEKRPKFDKNKKDIIRFNDGYILYDLNYESSLIMNGLKEFNTESYSLTELSSKSIYLDFLDNFGGRILSDGLDNFYTQFTDTITDILERYDLPTDYTELLLYASDMLASNKFYKHTSMDVVRYRGLNEIVAACSAKVISKAYGNYNTELKRGRKDVKLTIDKDAIIKEISTLNTTTDASVLNPVFEAETINGVGYKGPSGLNNERAYQLDKRAFDESMVNLLAMSTPNGAAVGVNRLTTMDMNVGNKDGLLKTTTSKEINMTKALSVSEAINPYGVGHDDPPRVGINMSQAKHMIRVKEADPALLTNGTDMALPYMLSNTFSYKAKLDGKVLEKTDDYMIIEYNNKVKEIVNLKEQVKKNSSSGFFITIKLDSELKKGSKFKANQIIAFDKESYSNTIGVNKDISYTVGPLCKVAIIHNKEGYEDSVIISDEMCHKMRSDIIIEKIVNLDKNMNIYKLVKPGDPIQEGEPLVIIQNTFNDEDISKLMKNLVIDEEDVTDIGRINIKSKYTGFIQDVKIFTTVDKSELTPSLQKAINDISKSQKPLKDAMKKYNVPGIEKLEDSDKIMDASGQLKGAKDGVIIKFYIKYEDIMSIGDKLTFFGPVKGISKGIFPIGEEPYTLDKPDEKIGALITLHSLEARQVQSIIPISLANRVMVELFDEVRNILKIKEKK